MKTLAALLPAAFLVACGSGALVQQGPSDTLRAYAQALQDSRVDDAYRLLSDDAKRSMSLEAFRRSVKENPSDALEIAKAIARPANDPVVTATVTMPSGEELVLVFEAGTWRIDAAAVDLYGQATPRQALSGFLRAFERKRYDVVLRYVPDAEKEGTASVSAPVADAVPEVAPKDAKPKDAASKPVAAVVPPKGDAGLTVEKLREAWEGAQQEQMKRIVQAITAALPTAQIEETGETASMAYGAGGTVAFVREHGVWKIRDF